MARMTLSEAATAAAELDRVLDRLKALHQGELEGSKGDQPRRSWTEWRRNRQGRLHELRHAQELAAALVAGLSGIGPARNGQLGGQRLGGLGTSAEAVELVAPKAGTQRALVLEKLRPWASRRSTDQPTKWTGLTDYQLVRMTGLPPNSLRPRRVELCDAGWIVDSGLRREHQGRTHVVWTLSEAARQTEGIPTTESRTTT